MKEQKTVLVTGGCGYIGSHTIIDLLEKGYGVVSLDNLSNSSEKALERVKKITGREVKNYKLDLRDFSALRQMFAEWPHVHGIIHFAALKSVGESVQKPLLYYENNIGGLVNLLRCVREFGVKNFVFSSSCSVYGNAKKLPVTEDAPLQEAESPYARTKQMGEDICRDFIRAWPQKHRCVLLRYFNPAGAHPSGLTGEAPGKEAENLVPVLTEAALGLREEVVVFGDDYPTRDGSCIRDYIHIMDLAEAHSLALAFADRQKSAGTCEVFNLGSGKGTTVLEAIAAFERSTGVDLPWRIGPRRPGDVIAVYANYDKAARLLGWKPRYGIDDIMRTAWAWSQMAAQSDTLEA